MKKILVLLLVLMITTVCFAYPSAQNSRTTFRNGYAWSGHPSKDLATQWAIGIEGEAAGLGTGKIWYVDSGTPNNSDGISWDRAVSTLDAIFAFISDDGGANRGDKVKIAEGHNEAFTAADAADMDVAGVTVIGYGSGSLMPTFDYDGVAGELVFGADNITIVNLRLRASTNTILKAIDIQTTTAGARIIGCEFVIEGLTDEFVDAIQAISTTGLVISNCEFDAGTAQAATAIQLRYRNLDTIIKDCYIRGDYSTANINGMGTLSSDLLIDNLILINGVVGGLNTEPAVELLTGTVGVFRNNDVVCNVAAWKDAVVFDGGFMARNTYNETAYASAWQIGVAIRSTTSASITAGIGI